MPTTEGNDQVARTATAASDHRTDLTRAAGRVLTPDLARGLMLLLIVLSNTGFHLWPAAGGASAMNPVGGSAADQVVHLLKITMLDLRSFPVFAFLFGYGIMQIYLRRATGGSEREAARVIRRRGLWLVVLGLLHATLLMGADILGAYGIMSIILGWLLLQRGERAWLTTAVALTVILGALPLLATAFGLIGPDGDPTGQSLVGPGVAESDLLPAAGERLATGLYVTFLGGSPLAFQMYAMILLGFWAARHRVLERAADHRRLLRWTAVVGLGTCWLGGLPLALAHAGVLDVPARMLGEEGLLGKLHDVSGIGGVGYVAVFALVAAGLSERVRRSAPVVAVAAVGKRSMSCYLTHSLLFAPALSAWGLGWGAHLGSASMAAFAGGVWLVTVVGAYALERAGRRGPAEVLMRRLTYRHSAALAGRQRPY